jgi:4,5-dihydroxyphthalate decarboxylase
MDDRALTFACCGLDRASRLLEKTMAGSGYAVKTTILPPEDAFRRAFEDEEFDISELSASTFLFRVGRGDCPYIGLPVFPSRAFRHAAIYIRSGGSVEEPRDLRGKIVGVRNYLNTAALVVRGLLSDQYGVASEEIGWRVGDVDDPERKSIALPKLGKSTDIKALPYGRTLTEALLAGEIDALVHYHPPRGFGQGSTIRRLFPDAAAAERIYFQETGIYPIMHLVGVRRALLEDDPSLADKLYRAFTNARQLVVGHLTSQSPNEHSLDVVASPFVEPDLWPYGIGASREALAALTRYAQEQGLSGTQLALSDLFAPNLLQT